MKVLLSTRNPHKVHEVQRILATTGVLDEGRIEIASLEGYDVPEVVEDGETFADNAILKAQAAVAATGLPALADDSGICVDALNGMPGIFSARWSGGRGDLANLELLLAQVADVRDERRGARFVAAVALVTPDGQVTVEEGIVTGMLLGAPRGTGGFGYDPIFRPDGSPHSTAEMAPEEKDQLSHRGRALRAIAPALGRLAAQA